MKKIMTFVLAAVMLLSIASCGGDGLKRDANGYLTEESAKSVAAQSVGYTAEEVYFSTSEFNGDTAGGDESAYFYFEFTDSVVDYTCKVNATSGTISDATAN